MNAAARYAAMVFEDIGTNERPLRHFTFTSKDTCSTLAFCVLSIAYVFPSPPVDSQF
jgi:hypothetical protein